MASPNHFDLCLAFPQWQGSGRSAHLAAGGAAAALVCERFAPRADVPIGGTSKRDLGVNNWTPILDQMIAARQILSGRAPRRVLTAGGDCSVDVAVIDYLNGLHPGLTVVWIDAHPDANSPETSPSGNFHGMPVAAIMGLVPPPMNRILRHPLDPSRFRYLGIRVADDGDRAFMATRSLTRLDPSELPEGPVHIHFDLDVLNPDAFPHLAYAEAGGPGIAEAVGWVAAIAAQADVVGLTITEFAPADGDAATDGQEVIERIVRAVAGEARSA